MEDVQHPDEMGEQREGSRAPETEIKDKSAKDRQPAQREMVKFPISLEQ